MTINLDNTILLKRIAAALENIDFTLRADSGLRMIANGLTLMIGKPGALTGEQEHFLKDAVCSSMNELINQIKIAQEQEPAE